MPFINRCGGGGGADVSAVTAEAGDVLSPKIFVDANGKPVEGTLKKQSKTFAMRVGYDGYYTPGEGYLFNEVHVQNCANTYTKKPTDTQTIRFDNMPMLDYGGIKYISLHCDRGGKTLAPDGKKRVYDLFICMAYKYNGDYKCLVTGTDSDGDLYNDQVLLKDVATITKTMYNELVITLNDIYVLFNSYNYYAIVLGDHTI